MTAEYDYVNNFYINYSYDSAGNIQSKNQQYLDSYGYPSGSPTGNVYYYNDTEWKDKLTGINGYNITYDASGNPLSYRDGITFTWQNGRQLASLQTADNSVSYKYDSNGMRTQKTDNGDTTYYYYDSNKNLIALTKGNYTLLFYYDSDGNVTSFKYNGTMYYYIKNLQGDVVKIINQSGTECLSYVYDAWGNTKSASGNPILRELNPFRYRGYAYDEESSLYYLQSRYYDPFTGRFLNADVYYDTATGSPLSTNLFAYCENDPQNKFDEDGCNPKYWINKQVAASDWCIIHSPKTKISFNCYGFAIGIYSGYNNLNPGFKSNQNNYRSYVSVDTIAKRVKDDLKKLRRSGKIVSNANYKCKKNEYLIAMRVTAKGYKYGYDYHFMRKGSDGIWKFKGGWSNWVFELKRGLNPGNVSWDSYYKKNNRYVVYRSKVYTSKIIYMAVTR